MRMSKQLKSYYKQLNAILDEVWRQAGALGYDEHELARRSGLCYQTVARLESRWTEFPRLRTVILLCQAVGLELVAVELQQKARKKAS